MSFALGEAAATCIDVGIKGIILMSIFMSFFICASRIILKLIKNNNIEFVSVIKCLYHISIIWLIGCVIFTIAYFNMKDYRNKINSWKDKEEGKAIKISGYIDNLIIKENVSYIYMDDVFIMIDNDIYDELFIGNYIEVNGRVRHFEVARNEGNFDEEKYYNSLGFTKKVDALNVRVMDVTEGSKDREINKNVNSTINEGINKIRTRIRNILGSFKTNYVKSIYNIWNNDDADIICGITVGYKDNISDEVKNRYRILGISHVLAISGLHLSIIGMGVFKLLRRRFRYLISGFGGIIVILLFGVIIGDSASIHRATIMFVMHIIALMIGRTYDMISATSFAAVILMFDCPYVIYNAGFILSFGAIVAICIISNIIDKTNMLTVTGIIQLVTLPLTMMLYYEISIYGIIINMLVIPTVGVLVVSGLLSGIIGIFMVDLGRVISGIGKLILWFYDRLYDVVRKLPYNNIVTGKIKLWLIIAYYIAIIIMLIIIYFRKKKRYLLLSIPVVILLLILNTDRSFYFSAIDVGQGDCLLIHNEDTSVYMIDAGSSDVSELYEYRIKSTLKAKGIYRIDGLIITHTDADHISAVEEMIEARLIKSLYLPKINKKDYRISDDYIYTELEAYAINRGVEVKYLTAGMVLNSGEMKIKCLYPFEDSISDDINELSVVIKIEYGESKILCMGDLGSEGESELLLRYKKEELDSDILKVGHHGSKYSSSMEFLNAVSPDIAVISCGEDNVYGHPHEETIKRLEEIKSKVAITAERGEIILIIP